jgi:hypothetical protein
MIDENLFPMCAPGIVPGLGYDSLSLDKQLYQMQLQQQYFQAEQDKMRQLEQDQLTPEQEQNMLRDQLLAGVTPSLLGNMGLTNDSQALSSSLLMPLPSLYAPQFSQYPMGGLYISFHCSLLRVWLFFTLVAEFHSIGVSCSDVTSHLITTSVSHVNFWRA